MTKKLIDFFSTKYHILKLRLVLKRYGIKTTTGTPKRKKSLEEVLLDIARIWNKLPDGEHDYISSKIVPMGKFDKFKKIMSGKNK